eukprot:TRINITY_DN1559_c0_g1_i1.p1 TRINITY_DN1559_c0_g1~~TRINITY_DN1559_c0_g1_i1.p1  ORF type:complete len:261 (+),score=81.13 TRINITY_DN1559_c0_g1_i1:46-783(+)
MSGVASKSADPFMPTLEALTKVLSVTAGKDKLAKILQYGGLLVASHVALKRPSSEVVVKARKLQSAAGAARKVFRLGNSISDYIKLRQLIQSGSITNPLHLLSIIRSLGMYFYWIFDHLVWISNTGLATVNTSKFSWYSSAAWFVGLLCSIVLDLVALQGSLKKEKELKLKYYRLGAGEDGRDITAQTKANLEKKNELLLNCLKNAADLIIASTLLNIRKFTGRTVGAAGVLSALIATYQMWPKK